jgi:thymidylate kinase
MPKTSDASSAVTGQSAMVVKIDGLDGCGKTTLLDGLALDYSNIRVLQLEEFGNQLDGVVPGFGDDRPVSEILKALALSPACEFDDIERELLWCICSRRTNRLIIPHKLTSHDLILVDRSNLGNLAYGLALNKSLGPVYDITTTDLERADLMLWVDTPVELCMSRLRERKPDLIEAKGRPFFEEVRRQFEKLLVNPKVRRLDGAVEPDALVYQAVLCIQETATATGAISRVFPRKS